MNTELHGEIIYIVGSARSGSTILNILLGNIDGVFSAGEINHYMNTGKDSDEYCSCGELVTACEFWLSVRNASEETIKDCTSEIQDLTRTFENWRSLLPSTEQSSRRKLKQKYIDYSEAYFDSILKVSKKSLIVDASKSPIRLFNLLSSPHYEYKVIHAIRDPCAVCVSLNKPLQKDTKNGVQKNLTGRPFRKTIKELYLNSILSIMVQFRVPKGNYLRVRQEDLVSDTKGTIDNLQNFLNIDCQQLADHLSNGGELQQSHNVAGNRLRMQKAIKITPPSHPWQKNLSKARALLLTIAVTPLRLAFKYPVFSKSPSVSKVAK